MWWYAGRVGAGGLVITENFHKTSRGEVFKELPEVRKIYLMNLNDLIVHCGHITQIMSELTMTGSIR
jgi:hypothetical protein